MLNSCLKYILLKWNWSEKKIISQNYRINYVGKDLRGYLFQPPVKSSVKTELKSGCSGLHTLRFWNPPAWRFNSLQFQCLAIIKVKNILLIWSQNLPRFSLWLFLLITLCTTLKILTVCLLNNLLLGIWRLLNCLSLLQTKQAQFPEPFLIGHVLQPTDRFCCTLLTSERSLWSGRPWEQHLYFLWRFSRVFKSSLHRKQQPPSSSSCSDCDVLNTRQNQELLVPKQPKK